MQKDIALQPNKMAVMPIPKLILTMAAPPMLSMCMQFSYNFVDSAFVAMISEDALAAVSLAFPISTLMLSLSIWLGVGVNILVARYLGQKDQNAADTVTTLGLILALSIGILSNLIVFLIIKPYFNYFTNDPVILQYAYDYMYICMFMQVPNMVHIMVQKVFQGTGNMLAPMGYQIAGVLLNFILDPLLIFGIGPFPLMGIKGAALSTVLGYTLSMAIALYMLFFTKQRVYPKKKGFTFSLIQTKEIFSLGLPSFFLNVLNGFMLLFANAFLIGFSTTAVAFFGAYYRLQQVIVMTVNGMVQGVLPIESFSFGAKNYSRLNETAKVSTLMACMMMFLGTALLWLFPESILRLFSASDSMMGFGVPALRIMSVGYLFNGLSTMLATYLQSVKHVRESIFVNILRQLALLVPLMWLLSIPLGMEGIWYAFPVAEILTAIPAIWLFRKNSFSASTASPQKG